MKQLQVLFYNKVILLTRISLSNALIQSKANPNPKRIQSESKTNLKRIPIQSNPMQSKHNFFQLVLAHARRNALRFPCQCVNVLSIVYYS